MFILQETTVIEQTEDAWEKLTEKFYAWADAIILHLPNFILAVLVFVFFLILGHFAAKLIEGLLLKSRTQASVRLNAKRITKIFVGLVGFFIALMVMNLSTLVTAILGAAGVIGLAIGLALQNTLSNTFSGVVLSFLPKLRIGDWVETNGFAGFVEDINLRCVVIRPSENNLVMIPNTKIIEEPFTNYSLTPRARIFITCGVGYESDLEAVEKLAIAAIEKEFPPQKGEEVEFFYQKFDSSSINFLMRIWTDIVNQKDQYLAENRAIKTIKKTFDENGVNIPFPIRTLDFDKNKFRSEPITINSKNER